MILVQINNSRGEEIRRGWWVQAPRRGDVVQLSYHNDASPRILNITDVTWVVLDPEPSTVYQDSLVNICRVTSEEWELEVRP